MKKEVTDKISICVNLILVLIVTAIISGCSTFAEEESLVKNSSISNSNNTSQNPQFNESGIISKGKFLATPDANDYQYKIFNIDPTSAFGKKLLVVSDSANSVIYKEEFENIRSVSTQGILKNSAEQLIVRYDDGGSVSYIKIFSLVSGKLINITEDNGTHVYGDVCFMPMSTERSAQEKPLQMVDIGTAKSDLGNKKRFRIYRYSDNEYKYAGTINYEEVLNFINDKMTIEK